MTNEMQQLVKDLGDVYGLECYFITPDGELLQYSRLIDKEHFDNESTPESRAFYGEDMIEAFRAELHPERYE